MQGGGQKRKAGTTTNTPFPSLYGPELDQRHGALFEPSVHIYGPTGKNESVVKWVEKVSAPKLRTRRVLDLVKPPIL